MPSLDVQIGQMLLVGFRGLAVDERHPIVSAIRQHHLGGVILFDFDRPSQTSLRNIESPEQVRRLTASLQAYAEIPLFIGIDQEGGRVNRLKERCGFPPTVSAQSLGQQSVEITRQHAEQTAMQLSRLGINLNFAPVVDLNRNPASPAIGRVERSFSADPNVAIAHARAWIEAHHAHGILCALKHFPGHGSAREDSHLGFVDVTTTWHSEELRPYQQLIQQGFDEMVMTAHIFHSGLDPEYPATLSRRILTGMLREELRFDGVIVSDDMQMQAIAAHYDLETAIFLAISAGVDILTFGNNLSIYDDNIPARAMEIIAKLVDNGRISSERVHASYRRIMRLKKRVI
ncbi:glycosyl hydrolase, family 3 [Candidatus Moduliflexus flocculans]|uniref:Glycosyl hydrolase, family 3 n=1 Tax=Candidatus Moduliflexus flocculans TaxID=1499966 RepID=A0A0S6W3P2_9BACT|nr:glycosyl hydrolase, family 3 [Candidatus Moduliflexus flocculans]